MKVKQLKKALEGVDENLEVFIHQDNDEFYYSLLESTTVDLISFSAGDDEEDKAEEKCLILTDEI